MRTTVRDEGGFTLVELLVGITILSLILVSAYSVMFSGVRGANNVESVVNVSGEARLGLNRMVRDTREARSLVLPIDEDEFSIAVDFDRDSDTPDTIETFAYEVEDGVGVITISVDGGDPEVLVSGVSPAVAADGSEIDLFTYSSNYLEFDSDGNGIATWQEVDDAPAGVSGGDGDGEISEPDLPFLSNVDFSMTISSGDDEATRAEEFFTQAQLRNLR